MRVCAAAKLRRASVKSMGCLFESLSVPCGSSEGRPPLLSSVEMLKPSVKKLSLTGGLWLCCLKTWTLVHLPLERPLQESVPQRLWPSRTLGSSSLQRSFFLSQVGESLWQSPFFQHP